MSPRIITADEARVLREAATPGPWHVGRSALCDCWRRCVNVYADQGEDVTRPCRSDVSEGDAPLLAAAPDLAATVEALHAEVARLSASRDRWRVAAGRVADTMCPECGPAVEVDEDGCCIGCGNGAMGTYVVELADRLRAAEAADRDAMFREAAP